MLRHTFLHNTLFKGVMRLTSFWTCSLGSEGGGEDALVGNVNKLMVSPPGYSGAPRRGHLVFDACFESGE